MVHGNINAVVLPSSKPAPSGSTSDWDLNDDERRQWQIYQYEQESMNRVLAQIELVEEKRPDDKQDIERYKTKLRMKYEDFKTAAKLLESTFSRVDPERNAAMQEFEKKLDKYLKIKKVPMKAGSRRRESHNFH